MQGRILGPHGRGHRRRLPSRLHRHRRQPQARQRTQEAPEEGRRAPAGHGRGPRRGGHQLAHPRGAGPVRTRPPHHLPRDHQVGHPGRPGRAPRRGPAAGARPGGPPHPGSPVRLHPLAGALEAGPHQAQRRSSAERGPAPDRRTGGGAPPLQALDLLGRRGRFPRHRRHRVHGEAPQGPGPAPGHRQGLRTGHRRPQGRSRRGPAGRAGGARARRSLPRRPALDRGERGTQGIAQAALTALHDLHPAAGGQQPSGHVAAPHHADRPAPLRGHRTGQRWTRGSDHLHAYRLADPQRRGLEGGGARDPRALRRRLHDGTPPLPDPGQGRPGGPRGDPPDQPGADARERGPLPGQGAARPLRTDLAPDPGLADGRRPARPHHRGPPCRRPGRRIRVPGHRFGRALSRLPARRRRHRPRQAATRALARPGRRARGRSRGAHDAGRAPTRRRSRPSRTAITP